MSSIQKILRSQSPKAGHGYSDRPHCVTCRWLRVQSQSPKAGHGYSDILIEVKMSRKKNESQSPKAGHGYSDSHVCVWPLHGE